MWPELPYDKWKDTLDTLHMWMQIVGKVKLELVPFLNQWWEVAFYVSARGITTGGIPYNGDVFELDFNFLTHIAIIQTSWNKSKILALKPQTVAGFYQNFMDALHTVGIDVTIWPVPVELQHSIPFAQDIKHASYDKEYVERFWHILVKINTIFEQFRTFFRGKSSPIHFFWGSFDLNGTRYSGKKATPPIINGPMGKIMQYSENEENFAFGFWPGDERFPSSAFYSYIYPQPSGIAQTKLSGGASFNEQLGEYILPYDSIRKAKNPQENILSFLESTYKESASLAKWNILSLQAEIPSLR